MQVQNYIKFPSMIGLKLLSKENFLKSTVPLVHLTFYWKYNNYVT